MKAWIDRYVALTRVLPKHLSDRILQSWSRLWPQHLPDRLRNFSDRYEHHLILTVADSAIEPTLELLSDSFPSTSGDAFQCSKTEARIAMLHRFAVAGAAIRYRALATETVEDVVAIDVALRRDERDWFERLPAELEEQLVAKLYYGHFCCHVFHQDYLLKKGVDAEAFEHRVLELLDARGGEYPAEHNVGHLYPAKPTLAEHYRRLDPRNCMNPGIGGMNRCRRYGEFDHR